MIEFGNYQSQLYVELDANLDGRWTRSEFVTRPCSMRRINPDFLRSKFKRWDKDGDGFLTLAEAEKMLKNNIRLINKHFDKKEVFKRDAWKWFDPSYESRGRLNHLLKFYNKFITLRTPHNAQPFLKSTLLFSI